MIERINTNAFKASLAVAAALISGLLLAAVPAFADAGDLDRSFGKNGRVTTDIGGDDGVSDVVLQPDGKILAAGVSGNNGPGRSAALVRYNQNGSLDKTFGGDGKVTPDFGGGVSAVAVQPDGKIVAAGGSRGFALARFNPDGTPDTTFGENGTVTTGKATSYEYTSDLVLQPNDSKIIVAGKLSDDFALARYNPDGTPDTTFGGDGMVNDDFGSGRGDSASAFALDLQSDGRIVAAGYRTSDDGRDSVLARYNPDGTLDTTFGKDGSDFSRGDGINALALQPDGRIVAAGYRSSGVDSVLMRYNPDGTLDPSFGGDGRVTSNFGGDDDLISALVLQPDGRLVAAGRSYDYRRYTVVFVLARYNRNGTLDRSFGGDGQVTTAFGTERASASAVALQPNGGLVAAGYTSVRYNDSDFALARYDTSGRRER